MTPSYIKIKIELERQIQSGELAIGEKLPSEPDMAKQFGVSRETLRSALKQMEREGKLRVRHGVGRYVVRPMEKIQSSIDRLRSTGEMILTAGLQEGEIHESIRFERCTEEWAEYLQIDEGDKVIVSERMRTANNQCVSFNKNILPYSKVGHAFERSRLRGSLMKFLEDECGIMIRSAQTEIIVPQSSEPAVQKLLATEDTTVLLLKQIHYDEDNFPVLFSYDYFRNDVFRFFVHRTR